MFEAPFVAMDSMRIATDGDTAGRDSNAGRLSSAGLKDKEMIESADSIVFVISSEAEPFPRVFSFCIIILFHGRAS